MEWFKFVDWISWHWWYLFLQMLNLSKWTQNLKFLEILLLNQKQYDGNNRGNQIFSAHLCNIFSPVPLLLSLCVFNLVCLNLVFFFSPWCLVYALKFELSASSECVCQKERAWLLWSMNENENHQRSSTIICCSYNIDWFVPSLMV